MQLSELIKMDPAPERAFGVIVDEPSFLPPVGLKEIGLVFPLEGEGIDEIDVAIAYSMAGVSTILEIPAERVDADAKYMVSTAANIGVSLSILPPNASGDAAAIDAWIERVGQFADAYFVSGIYTKELLPVTSFLEYMFAEVVSNVEGYAPRDPYIIENFANAVSESDSDRMKAKIREVAYASFGGREGFEEFVHAMALKVYDRVDSNMQDVIKAQAGSGQSEQAKADGE